LLGFSGIAAATAFVSAILRAAASPGFARDFAEGPLIVERDEDFADSLVRADFTADARFEFEVFFAMSMTRVTGFFRLLGLNRIHGNALWRLRGQALKTQSNRRDVRLPGLAR
jgi:hypothetical protein